jgi:MFS family permease
MALTNLAVFGGAFFTPILVGKITHTIGWWWTFYFVAIFAGLCLPLVFFFVPETAYRRDFRLNTDMASADDMHLYPISTETEKGPTGINVPAVAGFSADHVGDRSAESMRPLASWKEKLQPFNGRKTDESFFKLFLRPFPLFAHPAILWACLIQGTMIGWTVFIGIMLAAVFLGPPLFWNEVNTGYAYTGAFIGAIAGFLIAGILADWSARFMTRKNKGIYEPEFRLVLVIPQLIFGCAGLYLFGVTAATLTHYSWVLPVFAFGLEVCGMVIGAVASSLYIVDAHRKWAPRKVYSLLMLW